MTVRFRQLLILAGLTLISSRSTVADEVLVSSIPHVAASSATVEPQSEVAAATPPSDDEPAVPFVRIRNTAFDAGERFEYVIKYQFLTAGTSILEVLEGAPVDGAPTYQLTSSARSTKFIDAFFKVRDFNSSVIDKETLASLIFHQNLKEGHYHVIRTTRFDYDAKVYRFERQYKGKTTTREGELTEPVSDILSSFFYTRSLPLELGKDYKIRVFGDKKVYSLLVKVAPKLETVKVPAGKFECLRVEPFIVGDAIFKLEGGRMSLYLTNDRRRMPVLIRSKVTLGAFDAELTKYVLPTLPDK